MPANSPRPACGYKSNETEAAPGRTEEETAVALNLSVRTIERVRERFVEQGLTAALLPKPSTRR